MCMGRSLWVHMCAHACGGSKLVLEIILDGSDTLFTETGSPDQA